MTNTFIDALKDDLSDIVIQSHDPTLRSSRLGLAIRSVQVMHVNAENVSIAAISGRVASDRESTEPSSYFTIHVRCYNPDSPSEGIGIGASQIMELQHIKGSKKIGVAMANLRQRIDYAFRQSAIHYFQELASRRFDPRYATKKPYNLSPVSRSFNQKDTRGKHELTYWRRQLDLKRTQDLTERMSLDLQNVDASRRVISRTLAGFSYAQAQVKHVLVEVPVARIGTQSSLRESQLVRQSFEHVQHYGFFMLKAVMRMSSGGEQTYRRYKPLLYPGHAKPASIERAFTPFANLVKGLTTAPEAQPGDYVTVCHPSAAALLFHETIVAHGLSGTSYHEGTEGIVPKIGARLTQIPIDVIVDPRKSKKNGGITPRKYDDQLTPTAPVTIIKDGKLVNLLHTRESAGALETNVHGNAHMQYYCPLDVNDHFGTMSDVYEQPVSPGPRISAYQVRLSKDYKEHAMTLKEMRARARELAKKRGDAHWFEVHDIHGGQTLIKTGRWLGQTPIIYKQGTSGGTPQLVRGLDIRGDTHSDLKNIIGMGSDPETIYGICGCDSGYIPTAESVPSILLSGLNYTKCISFDGDDQGKEKGKQRRFSRL